MPINTLLFCLQLELYSCVVNKDLTITNNCCACNGRLPRILQVITDTCRYFSGQLIPMFQTVTVAATELGIKGPLECLKMSATTLVSLLFIYMIPIDCKITIFPFACY